MSASDHEHVTLKNGLTVPLAALRLGWALEARGVTFTVDGADLVVSPRDRITDTDRVMLKAHKAELIALVRYVEVI